MSTFTGYDNVLYKNVVGSSLASRSAFDGSVPYCVSCSAYESIGATDVNTTASTYFSVIGQANTGVASDNAHAGLIKQCLVNLHDVHFLVSGDGVFTVRITVCDPTSFPAVADHVYLYENSVVMPVAGEYELKIPDITGIVVSATSEQPLNVCVYVSTNGTHGRGVSFHCVATVDD